MTAEPETDSRPIGTFWMVELEEQEPASIEVDGQGSEVSFRRLGAETAGSLAQAMGLENPSPTLERFASGRRSYVAQVGGALAAYGWVSFNKEWIGELGMSIKLATNEVYIWDCATLPAYRGQGLYRALLTHILSELRAEGLRRVWIGADADSIASQKGIARAGFRPIADFFLTDTSTGFVVRGRPGVPEDLVGYIRHNLLPE